MNDALHDDAERLRLRQAGADADATRTPPPSGRGAPCVVASVTTDAGTAGTKVFLLQAQVVTGTETEGSTGTLTDASWSFYATNIGPGTPSAGVIVLATLCDFRWIFSF